MAFPPGSVFAGFTIERMLGSGGMGTVYLARHPRLPRWDALKLMSPALSGEPGFASRFEREADLAAQLHHPNIVTVFDRGCTDGQLWIDMQYVEGTDCSQVLEAGPLAPERAVHIIHEVGVALDYAHAGGLLHRDVKPANILLAPSRHAEDGERVLLMDFGIAKAIDEAVGLTSIGALLLTPDYAAPEQIRLERLDSRVDVYALGCVLYELLTGTVPFPAEYRELTLDAHLNQPPPRPGAVLPSLPPDLDLVVAKAMAKRPDDRYETCTELARHAAAAIRPPEPLPLAAMAAVERGRPRGVPKFVRRFATALVVIATLGVALVLPSEKSSILAALSMPLPRSTAIPDETMVAALEIDGNLDIYLVDSRTGSVLQRLTDADADDQGPVLSPTRETVIYIHEEPGERRTLRVMAADGTRDRELFVRRPHGCDEMGRPAWSRTEPDRLAIVCTDQQGRQRLQLVNTRGRLERTLVDDREYLSDPTFAPNGRRIAFATSSVADSDGGAIMTIAVDGSDRLRRLTTASPGVDNAPAWSPDGTMIAFRRRIDNGTQRGNFDIWVVSLNGEPRPLVEHAGRDTNPVWSPDSSLIAFLSDREAGASARNQVWVIPLDQQKPRQLLTEAGQQIAWTTR